MKNRISLFVGLLASIATIGQTTQKSLAWKIFGNGLTQPSYLYGTMHTQDKRAFSFQEGVMEAFEKSDVYVMEVNMGIADQFALMGMMMMDGDTSLSDLLTKNQYDTVALYFKDSLGQSLSLFNGMLPILTAQTIELKDLGQEQELPLDMYFAELAKDKGKDVKGLETAEEQIKALNSISYEDQATALYESVIKRYKGEKDNVMEKLVSLYVQGDLEGMLSLATEESMGSEKGQKDFENNLLLKRNRVMTQRMLKIINKESAFVAVGAAHLGGEEGIISMLRILGYTVEPLSLK